MIKLPLSLDAWGTELFNDVFKKEIACIDTKFLPLQQGLQYSSMANGENLSAIILSCIEDEDNICVTTGLFYTGVIAGCNCADDPTPVDEINEYCEVLFHINRFTADTTVSLII